MRSLTEVGKNINQDKNLAMQRYVEGYHETVSKMTDQQEKDESKLEDNIGHVEGQQYSAKQGERPQNVKTNVLFFFYSTCNSRGLLLTSFTYEVRPPSHPCIGFEFKNAHFLIVSGK